MARVTVIGTFSPSSSGLCGEDVEDVGLLVAADDVVVGLGGIGVGLGVVATEGATITVVVVMATFGTEIRVWAAATELEVGWRMGLGVQGAHGPVGARKAASSALSCGGMDGTDGTQVG